MASSASNVHCGCLGERRHAEAAQARRHARWCRGALRQILGQHPDVGALRAPHIEGQVRAPPIEQAHARESRSARGARSRVTPRARVFVERLAVLLDGRVHRRHLRVVARETPSSACSSSARAEQPAARAARSLAIRRSALGVRSPRRTLDPVGLVRIEQLRAELGRLAEANRQHARGERIERSGVARLARIEQALDACHRAARSSSRAACRAAGCRARRRPFMLLGGGLLTESISCVEPHAVLDRGVELETSRSACSGSSATCDSALRRNPAALVEPGLHLSDPGPPCRTSDSAPARVRRSPVTSTAVIVTLPMRSSFTSRRSSSVSSRWICSPRRRARGLFFAMRPTGGRARATACAPLPPANSTRSDRLRARRCSSSRRCRTRCRRAPR